MAPLGAIYESTPPAAEASMLSGSRKSSAQQAGSKLWQKKSPIGAVPKSQKSRHVTGWYSLLKGRISRVPIQRSQLTPFGTGSSAGRPPVWPLFQREALVQA